MDFLTHRHHLHSLKKHIHHSDEISANSLRVFNLINDFELYKDFLPGCIASKALNIQESSIEGMLTFSYVNQHYDLHSLNRIEQDDGLYKIYIEQITGPFESLHGSWTIESITDDKTRVTFSAEIESNLMMGLLLNDFILKNFINRFVESFKERAL